MEGFDAGSLCLLGIIIIAGLLLFSRLARQAGQRPGFGPERPQYDDPDIQSRGGFGTSGGATRGGGLFGRGPQRGAERPSNDDPNIRSRGGFGRSGGAQSYTPRRQQPPPPAAPPSSPAARPPSQGPQRPSNDDPNIRSRGGFGRDK